MTCYTGETFCIHKGRKFTYSFTYQNPDGGPVDTSGMVIVLDVRDRLDDATPIFQLAEGNGITKDENAGTILCEFTAAQTALLDWYGAHYCLYDTAGGTQIADGRIEVQI